MQLWFLSGNWLVQTYQVRNKILRATHVTHSHARDDFVFGNPNARLVAEIDAGFVDFGQGFFIDAMRNFYVLKEF
jgi:hypothetical protein